MNTRLRNHLGNRLAYAGLCFVLTMGVGHADDTEIYFNTGSATNNNDPLRPNVLFILDTSGSMTAVDPGNTDSRINILKSAMTQIVSELEDVNVGLMRFTGSEGGPVLLPISFIDSRASDIVGEPDDVNPSYSKTITNADNDAEEDNATGEVSTNDIVLEMTDTPLVFGGSGNITVSISANDDDAEEDPDDGDMRLGSSDLDVNNDNLIGLRFPVDLPFGATILSAEIEFRIDRERSSNTDVVVHGIAGSAAPFTNINYDISSRIQTSASVDWDDIPAANEDSTVTTPDIKTVVQEIVNDSGWTSGGSYMGFVLETKHGRREFYTRDGDTSFAPVLHIEYSSLGSLPTNQTIGLRFEDIQIPQGATVTEAHLTLTPRSYSSGPADLIINGEAADDSLPFTSTPNNITGRATTGASATWSVDQWYDSTPETTPSSINLKSVLQEIVNRGGWCGGNALSLIVTGSNLYTHTASSADDGGSAEAPQLSYTYQAGSSTGCFNKTEGGQVATSIDDAEEETGDGSMHTGSVDLDMDTSNIIGLRFQGIDIPQGATILEADMILTARDTNAGTASTTIHGQLDPDPAAFSSSDHDISDRPQTSSSVAWTHEDWVYRENYTSPDITTIVQELVNQGGWNTGGSMVFMLSSNTGTRKAYTNNGDAARAPRLRIVYESTGGNEFKTVRQRMLELINGLPASGNTPLVEVLYEAAHYWRGEPVVYGMTRSGWRTARISAPGTYCSADGVCPGADTGTYPPYGVYRPAGCSGPDSDAWNCIGEQIVGSPNYISPFSSTLSCQSNYQVLLTDGEANSNNAQNIVPGEYLGGTACRSGYTSSEECGVDIAEFMFNNDQSDTLENDQNVRTYTIAFGDEIPSTEFLEDVARYGNGGSDDTGFYIARNASDLIRAFTSIVSKVKKDPTSFVSPSLATNAFNRLLSRDEVYFGLFTPSLNTRWHGNIKKYEVCVDENDGCTPGEILDATGANAIDTATNKFTDTSRSIWSDLIDGRATTEGGSGAELTDFNDRIIYTDADPVNAVPTTGQLLSASGFKLTAANWADSSLAHIRDLVCPVPSTDPASECASRMLFLLGKISEGDPETDINATTRWTFNDVLHSSPRVITYGGTDTDSDGIVDEFYDRVLVGTNDGGLHFINGKTGVEEWVFMPEQVLANQIALYDNPETDHIYGLDTTPVVYTRDVDFDGIIEPTDGDKVYAYIAMRRGGSFIYALDLTASITSHSATMVPEFLWRIEGGGNTPLGDFTRMGQSWSQPQLANILVGGTETLALVFGGGYDPALDAGFGTAATSGNNNQGNSIYIVNATTGEQILSISGTSSGANIEVAAMQYSIPADATVFDSDGNGIDDRIYITDTGGQVWRVDLGTTLGEGVAGNTIVGRLAEISTAGTPADQRRFFEPASVVQVNDTAFGGKYDYVLIGSGYRSHPLDESVQDRFYAFRDKQINRMTDGNNDNLADGYPSGTTGNTPINETNMTDVTNQVLDSANTSHIAALGWYLNLTADGEKLLSAPIVVAGAVFFTSFQPEPTTTGDLCTVNVGQGNVYALDILNTKAVIDWNGDGTIDPITDRSSYVGGGIPSDVVPIFTKQGVVAIVGTEGGARSLGEIGSLPQYRTYWYDE